ncbi:MAG: hypothetical protein ACYC96_01420 [Fimbriimonadaceae bacterium]
MGEFLLHILSPTDCVRDRLAGFLFWQNGFSALEQAVGVAMAVGANLEVIREWCRTEGKLDRFETFRARLEYRKNGGQP